MKNKIPFICILHVVISGTKNKNIGFEVPITLTTKITILWVERFVVPRDPEDGSDIYL
jgi:hypothetical protein